MGDTDGAVTEMYQYEALPNAETYLRLLEFESDADGSESEISCHLTTWPSEEAPSYHAASYTWGSPLETERIFLDGKALVVRKNCADVLRQLLFFRPARHYWIDSICMNQNDLLEKSHQVAIMGDIFRKAEHVFACIGLRGNDGAEYAFQAISEVEKYHEAAECNAKCCAPDTRHDEMGQFMQRLLDMRAIPWMSEPRFRSGIVDLSRRPYFKRVWVMQEFLLAREVTFYCNYQRLPSNVLHWYVRRAWVSNQFGEGGDVEELRDNEALRGASKLLAARHQDLNTWTSMELREAMDLCRTRQCEDPRDTVYATMSLINWSGRTPVQPDYTKTAFALAVRILEHFAASANASCVGTLVRNLRIDETDLNVLLGFALRKGQLGHTERMKEPASFARRSPKLSICAYGYQLLPPSCNIVYRSEAQHEYGEVDHRQPDGTKRLIGFLPHIAQPGDWLVQEQDFHNARQSAFVLRWAETRFAIIGRACLSSFSATPKPKFRLLLDPADTILWAVSRDWIDRHIAEAPTERDLDMLETAVCGSPFSSFAERIMHQDEASSNDSE